MSDDFLSDWEKARRDALRAARDAVREALAEEARLTDLRDKLINRTFLIYLAWVISVVGLVAKGVGDGWIWASLGALIGAIWWGVVLPWRRGRKPQPKPNSKTHIVEVLPGHTYQPGEHVNLGGVHYVVVEANDTSITVAEQ